MPDVTITPSEDGPYIVSGRVVLTAPDGRALVGEGQKSGTYWALDRATLKPVWHTTVGPSSAAGGIIGSTAFDATRIYGPNTPGGEVWSLDHAGNIGWVSSEVGPLAFSPVAVSNGRERSLGTLRVTSPALVCNPRL